MRDFNENALVWRYMDFTKLVDLVLSKELHFSTLMDLRKLADNFEGTLPERWFQEAFIQSGRTPKDFFKPGGTTPARLKEIFHEVVGHFAVNCWHENEVESAAMWKLYLKSDEGIAIKSSKGKLKTMFDASSDTIQLFDINYVDYLGDRPPFDGSDFNQWATHKRRSFEHEREIRGLYFNHERKPYYRLKVDVAELIDSIAIAPSAPGWLRGLVERFVRLHGLKSVPVIQSSISDIQ